MFYTFVDKLGPRVFHRFVGADGKRYSEVVTDFPIELYTHGRIHDSVSLSGKRLSKIPFNNIADASEFLKRHEGAMEIFGQQSFQHQFISQTYPGTIDFDIRKIVILNFDIEVSHDEGFPHAHIAKDEILSISMKVFGRDQKITLGLKDYTPKRSQDIYVKYNNEAHLLNGFIGFWKRLNPDIITGWNIESFDIPYLVNRMTRVLGEKEVKKLSPFHKEARNVITKYPIKDGRGEESYRILGITMYDYLPLYKKFATQKLETYKLDFVGEFEGVGNKVDLSAYGNSLMRLYRENFELFIEYNEQDVMLVEKIDMKQEFMRLAVSVAMMTKSRLSEVFGTVKIWDNLIYNMLRDKGIQIPPAKFDKESKDFIGGFVKDPIPGRYKWVVSLDLTALYPTIIRMYNMSPETLVGNARGAQTWLDKMLAMEPVTDEAKNEGCTMAANGSVYRQDIQGVLPEAMTFVFEERKRYKKLMLEAQRRKELLIEQIEELENAD